MLRLLEGKRENKLAQSRLNEAIRTMKSRGTRAIGFQGGNISRQVFSKGHGELWGVEAKTPQGKSVLRYWNAFGVFDEDRSIQHIAVEINVPSERSSAQVAGFYAVDETTGDLFLMHDGRLGGGRPGIGKESFLAWSGVALLEVTDGNGKTRPGIPVARLGDPRFIEALWQFVSIVHAFKAAATSGGIEDEAFQDRLAAYRRYRDEFWGKKSGSRTGGAFEYVSYHGQIVRALMDEVSSRNEGVAFNTPLIDLYVMAGGRMTEVYEVKTGIGRQSMYTAIGQLVTHSAMNGKPRKVLVIPDGDDLPDDLGNALRSLDITIRTYSLKGGKVVLRAP